MQIERKLRSRAIELFQKYPVLTITGPRQSGKTTFVRSAFSDLNYINLEDIENREFATEDPKGLLRHIGEHAIIDEIQNVPQLTSAIQVAVDEKGGNSHYILTGSRQFEVMQTLTQSLAGRTALLTLLPFSLAELKFFLSESEKQKEIENLLLTGFYPRIYDQRLEPSQALGNYYTTYIERDVRTLVNVKDLSSFTRFVKILAGHTGSLLNISSVARDTGISHTTAKEWLSILQASYVVYLLNPWYANVNKRLIKSPKLYFYDVGLVSYLLGAEIPEHLNSHPLKGSLFENFIVIEFLKHRLNAGKKDNLSFYRDSHNNEIDLLYQNGTVYDLIEIKSGETMNSSFFTGLGRIETQKIVPAGRKILIYGGNHAGIRSDTLFTGWHKLDSFLEKEF